jgi:signal transduction histidine kinase
VRIALDSPFDPTDFATFRRQETTLIVLNLGVLAALATLHVAFVGLLGPPPRLVLVAIAARFIEQTAVLAWLQGRTDPLSPGAVRWWAHASTWVGLAFGILVISLGTFEDSHYPVLFVLPLLGAAFRFSLPAALGVTLLASSLTVGQVWLHGRSRPQMAPSEYFESVTMALVYFVVTPVVSMLVRGLHHREQALREHADELRRTRDRLVAEEKFSAVGRLASAVAHEVRNPVAMIVTSLATATKPATSPEIRSELFEIARREASRLERVTTDFLAYARPRPVQRRGTCVEDVLRYVADLLRVDADGRGVVVQVEVDRDREVEADAFQLHQALLNLGANAVQAVSPGGTVELIGTTTQDQVVFAVENPGPAIPGDVARRLFEPFFTTRAEGTGLGLSIAKKIAEAHGGDVTLAVNTAALVRFELAFPLAAHTSPADAATVPA